MASTLQPNQELNPALDKESPQARADFGWSVPYDMGREKDRTSAPVSFAQERLWFLDQINSNDISANLQRAVRIKGYLQPTLLQQAFEATVNRHELLRTTFATPQLEAGVDSQPVQLIASTATLEFFTVDLGIEPEYQRLFSVNELARVEAERRFDLELGPLLRTSLLRLAEQDHILVITAHRIIADEESLAILFRDLFESYRALSSGSSSLPDLPIQYADFARWQRLSDTEMDGAQQHNIEYWNLQLQHAPVVTELPMDRPRSASQSGRGDSVDVVIEHELTNALRDLSHKEGVALPVLLMAALQVLIFRHSHQSDIIVGTSFVAREEVTKDLIGPFANALPIRLHVAGTLNFRQLLALTKQVVCDAHARRNVPFEKLVQGLKLERSLSHPPLFQILLKWNEYEPYAATFAELAVSEFDLAQTVARFDLTLEMAPNQDQFLCRFIYSTDLFDEATIEAIARRYKILLQAIVDNPDCDIVRMRLLTQQEEHRLLVDWNNTAQQDWNSGSIQELFESQAKASCTKAALFCGRNSLSYQQLNERANQLAHFLRKLGIGPEKRVAVCLGRSLEMVVALLATLKAGGAYVPLDPAYPLERLAFMMRDSGASVLLTEARFAQLPAATEASVVCLDRQWDEIACLETVNPENLANERNLAYVIYTSGSTGQPKGVAIEHRNALAFLHWAKSEFSGEQLQGVLASTSLCFDLSVFELFAPLCFGGTVVIAENVLELPNLSGSQSVTLVNTVPSALAELLESGSLPRSVIAVNLAGEPLRGDLAQKIYKQESVQELRNLYGPSEDTTYSTCARVAKDSFAEPTIGRPIANTQTYIFDSSLQPVPIGVSGELYIGGSGLARCYLERPELTAEKFLPNAHGSEPGARVYKTGDLARYEADGHIQFLGRTDQQVKVRGYRIELGEIETVLRQHPTVKEAAVITDRGRAALVAYLVVDARTQEDGRGLSGELRKFLLTKLPEYMVPGTFSILESLPRTPNGKINRRALWESAPADFNAEAPYVAPRNTLEQQLVDIWRKVLNRASVGVKDNFFELGGHSLLAARMFARVENRFGKHLPLATLFQSPTIEQLANVLDETQEAKPWTSLVAIQPLGSKPPLFCVHAAGANVLIYRPLARHLGNDQPLYALQAQGLDGQRQPLTTVKKMAEHYLSEICAVQPFGPYYLLGASFGGLVVFEMAKQLVEQRQKVALVAMLNTNCPFYTLAHRVRCHLGHLRQRGAKSYSGAVLASLKGRITAKLTAETNNGIVDPELQVVLQTSEEVDEALFRTVSAILRAEEIYRPPLSIYPGKITLFWARDAATDFEDNRLGWKRVAADFDLYEVPGTHTSMREEPNVRVLAEKLKPCLDAAQMATTSK